MNMLKFSKNLIVRLIRLVLVIMMGIEEINNQIYHLY